VTVAIPESKLGAIAIICNAFEPLWEALHVLWKVTHCDLVWGYEVGWSRIGFEGEDEYETNVSHHTPWEK